MRVYRSNATQTRILYLKIVSLYTWILYFLLFYFQDILCVQTMTNSHPVKHGEMFIVLTLYVSQLFIFNACRGNEIFRFLPDSWNNENLAIPIFRDRLFAENHFLILNNSSLTLLNNVLMLMCSKNKLILSANIMETSTFEELGRSFTYNINNSPTTEPCGTSHLISWFSVLAHSVITASCHFSN